MGSLPANHPPINGLGPKMQPPKPGDPVDDPSIPAGSIVVQVKGLEAEVLRGLKATVVEWSRGQDHTQLKPRDEKHLDDTGSTRF
ncbi:MAG: hypothetical protein CSA75_01945, partial [Sorangium cellulosum]